MRRPQIVADHLSWIMNNSVYEPNDWEKDCWIAKKCGPDNRPRYWYKGKLWLLYKFTWVEWYERPFPKSLVARHLCEDSRCVNPLHIKPGTASENERDKSNKVSIKTELQVTPRGLDDLSKINFWLENHCARDGECLLWLGSTGSDGYARRNVLTGGVRKKVSVHRWIYSVLNNEDYSGDWVARHLCHTRSCVNPLHIEKGGRSENAIDSRARSAATKLKESDVTNIIEEYLTKSSWSWGEKKKFKDEWAERLGVSHHTIHNIITARRWKDVWKRY